MIKKIAVLGAGHAGATLAALLAIKGFEVRLYDHPKFKRNIEEIAERGGVELIGVLEEFGKVSIATTDIKSVVPGADVVMFAVPSFVHSVFMEKTLPYLEDGQIVVVTTDNFGSLVFREMMRKKGVKRDIKIAGTSSQPFIARLVTPAKANLQRLKSVLPVAALPATDTPNVVKSLKEVLPAFVPAKSVLELGFGNFNMITHPPTVVLNAARIEDTKGDFLLFRQGVTRAVSRVMEKMDEERIKVAEKLGLEVMSTLDILRQVYSSEKRGEDLYDWITGAEVWSKGRGPASLDHRYMTEDVPYTLVPISSFGKLTNTPTPVIDSIIVLSSIMLRTDYFKSGRGIKELGLSGMRSEQILNYVQEGTK